MGNIREYRTRLRWFKRKADGMIVSEPVMAGCEVVRVFINPENSNYLIKDVNEKYVFASGKAESLRELKTASKARLVSMAAKFFDEVRLGHKEE
jgi:hypothetical protein